MYFFVNQTIYFLAQNPITLNLCRQQNMFFFISKENFLPVVHLENAQFYAVRHYSSVKISLNIGLHSIRNATIMQKKSSTELKFLTE
jgi:hypothetical protein